MTQQEQWPDITAATADAAIVIPNPGPGKRVIVTVVHRLNGVEVAKWSNQGRIDNMGIVWHNLAGCEITYRIEDMPEVQP